MEKEWGIWMEEVKVELYSDLEVEVTGYSSVSGKYSVKVPSWERVLRKKDGSRAA